MGKFGGIDIIEQKGMTMMPQKAASAWSAIEKFVGAKYTALVFVGTQVVKGVNYVFIAEQSMISANPARHIVLVTINEFDGEYSVTGIEPII